MEAWQKIEDKEGIETMAKAKTMPTKLCTLSRMPFLVHL